MLTYADVCCILTYADVCFVGKVRVGQLGWTDYYLRNSNLHVKSECDHLPEDPMYALKQPILTY